MAEDSRKLQLIAELAQARSRIGVNAGALRHDLEVGRRVKSAFKHHIATWLGGASVLGLLLARVIVPARKVVVIPKGRRHKTEEKAVEAGLVITALKFAFDLVRPMLTKWLTRWVTDYAMGRSKSSRRV